MRAPQSERNTSIDLPAIAADILEQITIDGKRAFEAIREETALFTSCGIRSKIDENAVIHSPASGATAKFFDLLYEIEGLKSGMHHQDGLLWIRDPRISKSSNPRVAIESIAPTVLDMLDVPVPAHLKDPSLLKTPVLASAGA